ncbi:RING finger protein nhl-1-like [Schistocerca piceifrons]|uniref:RING finger protein nhl-1-like n=1 Tax=Schistocerca piceifrons TaxID=274613 RepID=UPI001F5F9F1C|nr:RING finger protein nhl-1-like [Schistocerca piceifrons]
MTSPTSADGKVRSILLRAVSAGEIKLHPSLAEQQQQQQQTASLEQLVECPLCKGRMKDPRMLPACQHSFCKDCLVRVARDARSVSCPVCGAASSVPVGGAAHLPGNLYVGSLLRLLAGDQNKLQLQACNHCGQPAASKRNHSSSAPQSFCDTCWSSHTTALEDQLSHMRSQVLEAAEGIDRKEADFKERCERARAQLAAAVDGRVAELRRLQREADQRLSEAQGGAAGAAGALRGRLQGAAARLADAFRGLQLRHDKVDAFLTLHGEAANLVEEASSWSGGQLAFNAQTLELSIREEAAGSQTPPEGSGGSVENLASSAAYRSAPRLCLRKHWLRRPGAVCWCPWAAARHLLYVAARDGELLAVDAATGRLASRLTVDGLLCPAGVAFSGDRCYVTDKYAHCVHELDAEGRVVASLGKKGGAPGQFRSPEGLAVAADEAGGTLLYVCDTGNDRLQVLRPDGTVVRVLGVRPLEDQPGVLQTEFDQPTGVAASRDRVAVADSGNNRVKVYNTEGEKILELSGENGPFNCPECVAIDRSGRIIVGDSGNQRVQTKGGGAVCRQVFSEDGRLVCSLGGRSSGIGWVSGVAASGAGELALADGSAHALYVF